MNILLFLKVYGSVGLVFAIITFLGSLDAYPKLPLAARLRLSVSAIFFWSWTVVILIIEIIEAARFRNSMKSGPKPPQQ